MQFEGDDARPEDEDPEFSDKATDTEDEFVDDDMPLPTDDDTDVDDEDEDDLPAADL